MNETSLIHHKNNKKKFIFSDENIKRITVHELGHTISGIILKSHSKFLSVHLNPWCSHTPGYTVFENESNTYTKEKRISHMVVLLCGPIAENLIFNNRETVRNSKDYMKA